MLSKGVPVASFPSSPQKIVDQYSLEEHGTMARQSWVVQFSHKKEWCAGSTLGAILGSGVGLLPFNPHRQDQNMLKGQRMSKPI